MSVKDPSFGKALLKVVFWGTYDMGKPRVRLLLAGMQAQDVEVIQCHADVWKGVEDKYSLSKSPTRLAYQTCRWLFAYPRLICKYTMLPSHDLIIVPYLGQLDVLLLWLFARLRRVPVVWDVYISLYEATVTDRGCLAPTSFLARCLYAWEWLACRAATLMIMDTAAHARHFEDFFHLPTQSAKVVQIGAETDIFSMEPSSDVSKDSTEPFRVLFYGQFIPLYGIDTIIRASLILESHPRPVQWILIGQGQEDERIDGLIQAMKPKMLQRIKWVPYEELPRWIKKADVCLGIFGTTDKAQRVIPNKAFEILAARRPLITADTPAIREWLTPGEWVKLVPPGSPEGLARAVLDLMKSPPRPESFPSDLVIGPAEVGRQLRKAIDGLIRKTQAKFMPGDQE